MKEAPARSKLPWIVGGCAVLALLCGCAGVVGAYLYHRAGGGDGAEMEEWVATRRAALSQKGHHDPFHAPDGAEVHINQSAAMGPSARDNEILGLLSRNLGGAEQDDVVPDQEYRVDLFQEGGAGSVTRVSVDLDRDGHPDELWKIEGTRVRRAVSSADDENYDQMWLWQNGLWLAR